MNCLICNQGVTNIEDDIKGQCHICKEGFNPNRSCKNEHYICGDCYNIRVKELISDYVLKTDSKNPEEIMLNIMKKKHLYMHGPIHHYLMPAALLAAYKNAGGDIDLENSLTIAEERSSNVPGGICGLWGACGAPIGAGIFTSIITDSSPLAGSQWRLPNNITARALEKVSSYGGPRCCKRNAFLTIPTVVDLVEENLGIQMEKMDEFKCFFFNWNNECIEGACPFHPHSKVK